MDGSSLVGSGEFSDLCEDGSPIAWPEGYANAYIGQHDVLPTKRFFGYVLWRAGSAAVVAGARKRKAADRL